MFGVRTVQLSEVAKDSRLPKAVVVMAAVKVSPWQQCKCSNESWVVQH